MRGGLAVASDWRRAPHADDGRRLRVCLYGDPALSYRRCTRGRRASNLGRATLQSTTGGREEGPFRYAMMCTEYSDAEIGRSAACRRSSTSER